MNKNFKTKNNAENKIITEQLSVLLFWNEYKDFSLKVLVDSMNVLFFQNESNLDYMGSVYNLK